MYYDFVIIGAGIAGIKSIEGIRSENQTASILLINGEDRLPYKRTQLSKQFAKGFEREEFTIASLEWFHQQKVIVLNDKVMSISLKTKSLKTFRQSIIQWNKLIIASGSSPVCSPIKGNGRQELLFFRSALEAENLRQLATKASKIIVIGGGVLGVELASALTNMNKSVSLVHTDPFLMNRYFDEYLSNHLSTLLQTKGIQLILHEKVKSVSKTGNGKLLVEIGEMIHLLTDLVVVAQGVQPTIECAKKAGLETKIGIVVNANMCTSHPDVFAAGDVTQHQNDSLTGLWHDAENQGVIAGKNAAGGRLERVDKKFRLKMEIFNQFYFSMNRPMKQSHRDEVVEHENDRYYRFFFTDAKLIGALMLNDKQRAKTIEKAVNEHWSREQVIKEFTTTVVKP
ncbi:MAG: FAD-dependent oxidoreductase [Bacteroidales bacterium]|nr:FAD-dependent oxidoreductase [Bacteroidales bacterium]